MNTPDVFRVISWNVQKGRRAKEACGWINGLDPLPQVVCWQELQPGQAALVAGLLGMRACLAAPRPGSRNDNAIFVRESELIGKIEEHPHAWAPWHAPANISLWLRGPDGTLSERPVNAVSHHACYWSDSVRGIEADWLTTLAKPGWLSLVMGDFNDVPADTEIDGSRIEDRAFYTNRTCLACGGERRTANQPDRTLRSAGYVDVARYAYERFGRGYHTLAPTAGYGPDKAKQGGLMRIDRGYATGELAQAIAGFRVGDPDQDRELARISDHLPLVLDLDPAELLRIMNRRPDQVGP